MSLSREDVRRVSLLARLRLSDAELDHLTDQLDAIVGYVDQLSQVDTEGVTPLAHAIDLTNVFADDLVAPSLSREEALAAAPHHDQQGYLVPAVLGE